jgi:hypothetical protein
MVFCYSLLVFGKFEPHIDRAFWYCGERYTAFGLALKIGIMLPDLLKVLGVSCNKCFELITVVGLLSRWFEDCMQSLLFVAQVRS